MDPISLIVDAKLSKVMKKNSATFFEIELDIGDLILISVKDIKLKAQVSTALVTIIALCKANPFCK